MAIKQLNTHQSTQVPTRANLKGVVLGGNGKPVKPGSDFSMLAETGLVAAAQTGAFFTLRIPLEESIMNPGQFDSWRAGGNYQPDQPDGTSAMNTPVYGRIILGKDGQDNTYTDAQGKKGSYKTVELDCALCAVEFNNKVVVTDIQGLGQSIKEFMSNGDNNVSITGIYNNTPGIDPFDFRTNLNAIFKAPVPIPVTNYYLNSLDIYYVVIMPGTAMGQEEGKYSTQRFTIKAITDTPMTEMLP